MKKRVIWGVVSGWMVAALLLASCAPAATEEGATPKEKAALEKGAGPQYGGTLTLANDQDLPTTFESHSYLARAPHSWDYKLAHEQLLVPNPLKGPGGTKEWKGQGSLKYPPDIMTGNLAESWEIIEPDTIRFKIREGIHWQDKPPMNGAELTAEDVVYNYIYTNGHKASILYRLYPVFGKGISLDLETLRKHVYVDPDDSRTVVMKGTLGQLWMNLATYIPVMWGTAFGPLEEALDGPGYGDWKGVVGTGAMIWTDYVRGTTITLERNPNYWKKDAFHPENQLPYIDKLQILIIPDASTRQAALRAGKIDALTQLSPDDYKTLKLTNPELMSSWDWLASAPVAMYMRHDVKPMGDIRVRRALMMAINFDAIVNDFYEGEATKWYWPAWPQPAQAKYMVALEDMPQDVQDLYGYHPDKSKELLAEAGYPDGFKTSIVYNGASATDGDLLTIIKANWADVGVDLELRPKETGVHRTMKTKYSYEHGVEWGLTAGASFDQFVFSEKDNNENLSRSNVPLVTEVYKAVQANYFDPVAKAKIYREAYADLHRAIIHFRLPIPKDYSVWQPWLGGYNGESRGARYLSNLPGFAAEYVWINQELKKSLGY